MFIARVVIPVIALLIGGWLVFDGARALRTGDYLTAKNGPNAGRLGPWAALVSATGLDPRGNPVKYAHVVLGAVWLISTVLFVASPGLGRRALLLSAIGTLWYLPLGTVLSIVEIVLLLLPQVRNLK